MNFLPLAADFYQISLKMKKVLAAQQQAAPLSVSSVWNQTKRRRASEITIWTFHSCRNEPVPPAWLGWRP